MALFRRNEAAVRGFQVLRAFVRETLAVAVCWTNILFSVLYFSVFSTFSISRSSLFGAKKAYVNSWATTAAASLECRALLFIEGSMFFFHAEMQFDLFYIRKEIRAAMSYKGCRDRERAFSYFFTSSLFVCVCVSVRMRACVNNREISVILTLRASSISTMVSRSIKEAFFKMPILIQFYMFLWCVPLASIIPFLHSSASPKSTSSYDSLNGQSASQGHAQYSCVHVNMFSELV